MKIHLTKQQTIYRKLRGQIMRAELDPGRRLVIDDIAKEMGVSAIPVREALQLLQAERLIDVRPHAGATVAGITPEGVEEIFAVLEGLEMVAVRQATGRIGADLLNRLVEEMDAVCAAGDFEKWSGLNVEFHRTISRTAEMPLLLEMTERALDGWDRMRRFFFKGSGIHRMAESQAEHRQIAAALAAGNAEEAERLVRGHNRAARQHYITLVGNRNSAKIVSQS